MGPTYNQQQFNLVYKQQQNVLLKITMGSIKYQIKDYCILTSLKLFKTQLELNVFHCF